ncbi:hypothetical protein CFBP498_34640 [Xanthomonas hortorum pv. vitians]|uniref:Uncharacterized protein n=2 Tax=Xanthomonas hortorum TaxID=56454 RepID=A0A6V7EE57_9XANT|nr:hypothetical protein CFBP2044_17300 [Xanthomonas hortorum pv. cynarae]CAD0324838.1 hypothetical protein CFBP8129_18340 [Xanthomonas hortorum pv. gardneri]CAD0349457.1 hypothetical protein CFBP498_34640 [Xanthomonas hortorum pv. vitians]CAH2708835.1 hypothetical protein NCPPB1935_13860 [Xanthomonas campestris pv. nigromaculans]CAD0323045.1 hypothetical protein CFBP2044_17300 [Xanthomonas hortorum pv. cynarae]
MPCKNSLRCAPRPRKRGVDLAAMRNGHVSARACVLVGPYVVMRANAIGTNTRVRRC